MFRAMFSSNRLFGVAAGGILAVFLWASCGLAASDSTPPNDAKIAAPIEQSDGPPKNSPDPKKPAQEQQPNGDDSATNSQPEPPTIQRQDQETPCDARCQAAEKREGDHLAAQQSMARSTERLLGLTKWQTIVGGIGLVLLVATVVYTHMSYRLTAKTTQSQLRAYVFVEWATRNFPEALGGNWVIDVKIANDGETPAKNVMISLAVTIDTKEIFGNTSLDPARKKPLTPCSLAPGAPLFIQLRPNDFDGQDMAGFQRGEKCMFLVGRIDYLDCFGNPRFSDFTMFHVNGPLAGFGYFETGNDYT